MKEDVRTQNVIESMEQVTDEGGLRNMKILGLPVRLSICVGQAQLTVKEILALTPESIIALGAKIEDPAEIFFGDRLLARGEPC